jgi:dienelactone hydrolase
MHTRIIQSLLSGCVLGVALLSTSTLAQAETKHISAMPIPTHTAGLLPTGPAVFPGTPTPPPAAKPQAQTQAPTQAAAAPRPQAEKILFDNSDMQGSKPLLSAIWVRAAPINAQQPRKPTVIALHGCGGLYSVIQRDKNLITPRSAAMARELRNAGYNVLMPDSLTPRGKVSICTESLQQRDVSTAEQARDVQAALRWLAKQDDVDPDRIALLGWAHGGSAVMKALAIKPVRGAPQIKAGIAFYPSCAQFDPRVTYKPSAPLLMLMGDEDDWAPVAACNALTQKADPAMLKLNTYPDSYHEFDAPGMPLHVRLDVPNPQHPGQGVTSGTNPEAKVAAYHDVFVFLDAALK